MELPTTGFRPDLRLLSVGSGLDFHLVVAGVVVFTFLTMPFQHLVGLFHEAVRFVDALPQFRLAGFDFSRLLFPPSGALFPVRHQAQTFSKPDLSLPPPNVRKGPKADA